MKNIKEDLIHYIWKTKSFNQKDLLTTEGVPLNIISFGQHNHDAGPDFLNARVSMNGVTWAGHIEIHLKSSDWLKHRHNHDRQYQNVILHVVLEADTVIRLSDGTIIPCLELRSRIDKKLISKYQYLQNTKSWIPCASEIASVDTLSKQLTIDRNLTERLSNKTEELITQLSDLNNDWSELIYQKLAWAFGLKVNADAMLVLAKSLPYKIIQKNRDHINNIEALLFGQSGLLPDDPMDSYVERLRSQYRLMQEKYALKPISKVLWKFSRLRPAGFPTIRIAQFAQLLHLGPRLEHLFFHENLESAESILDIKVSDYWKDHYRFGKLSSNRKKSIGTTTKAIIMINAVVPILFMYGIVRKSESHKEKAIHLLERIPPEHNGITNRWKDLGMNNQTAADSQALIQLKKFNCDHYKCMDCPIGHKIISDTT